MRLPRRGGKRKMRQPGCRTPELCMNVPKRNSSKRSLCAQGKKPKLDPVFEAGPDLLQAAVLGAAADPDLAMILEGNGEWMVRLACEGEAGVRAVELLPGAAEDDHALAGVIARTPAPIILVAAD